ncbi:MAG: toll/interleukin-1 receptor domain-containing protein [Erythrobacter sp.]|nr:toll/interleukin-1 receptor domain-containing protein [Erythrobacter sp.]
MADVFISYSRTNQEKVAQIARAIEAEGYEVWWDAELPPHMSYGEVITAKIEGAKAGLVVWSKEAAASEWVRAEADAARNQKKLIQTALGDIIPPLPFNQIQCANLGDWNGEADHPGWNKVKQSLVALCGARIPRAAAAPAADAPVAPPVATPAPPPPAPVKTGPIGASPAAAPPPPPPPPPPQLQPMPTIQPLAAMGSSSSSGSSGSSSVSGVEKAKPNYMVLGVLGGVLAVALLGLAYIGLSGDGNPGSSDSSDTSDSSGKPGDEQASTLVTPNGQPAPGPAQQNAAPGQQAQAAPAPQADGYNRDVVLINQSGDTIMYLYWSNVNEQNWGPDRLGSGVLADGQNMPATVDDGTGACNFDFRAETAGGQEIERRNVNVCGIYEIYFN